ncbi:hypothetical protein [Herbaspirillum huttiense]|uniref:hypothetical protein n=1 Tax=Herbaspirillum huttiense TaxID=863372 RepID=UPI002176CC9E|nr:hypothetical protein [Herbaspirillum huttiense]UWE15119.1 hypothetical protein NY669_18720 [Herbaspirillum huttiense]
MKERIRENTVKLLFQTLAMALVCVSGTALAKDRLPEGYSAWHNEDPCDAECREGDRPVTHMVRDIWLYRRGDQLCGFVMMAYAPRGKVASGRIAGKLRKDGKFLFNFTDDWSHSGSLGLAELDVQRGKLRVKQLELTDGYLDFDDQSDSYKKVTDKFNFGTRSMVGRELRSCQKKIDHVIDFLKDEK